MDNPFPYSLDNKRYHTWNYYLRQKYHTKVFKVALNANFTCPNRDGTCGIGGCTFCSSLGSGDTAGDVTLSLENQYQQILKIMKRKWPDGKPIAYFQAYTNTYAPLDTLKACYEPFIKKEEVLGIAIATRADCLEDEKIEYLASLATQKEIWIELGLQSIHDETMEKLNRGHDFQTFLDCIEKLKKTPLKVCAHIMNSLPGENADMMIETAKELGKLDIDAIKIHMLHVLKQTKMGEDYLKKPFTLLSLSEYVDICIKQLEWLPAPIVIQRLTGDPVKADLIAPEWVLNKTNVLNCIDKEMAKRNTWQGKALIKK